MKVIISGRADVTDLSNEPITDAERLRTLDGIVHDSDVCSNYLDGKLGEIGLIGGSLRLAYRADLHELRIITEFGTPRELKPAELKALIKDTCGQWSDGIGESCFDYLAEKHCVHIDCLPSDQVKKVTAEHVDDGVTVPKPKKSPLLTPAAKGDLAKLEKLLAKGEDINGRDVRTGKSVLMTAISDKQVDGALLLIERGADINLAQKDKYTPLQLAARFNLLPVASALLDKGADVNAPGYNGYTALCTAALSNHVDMLELLHVRGADINLQQRGGRTPIMYANYLEGAKWFLDHGADLSIRNDEGQDALAFARRMQASEERLASIGNTDEHAKRWKQIGDMIEAAIKSRA